MFHWISRLSLFHNHHRTGASIEKRRYFVYISILKKFIFEILFCSFLNIASIQVLLWVYYSLDYSFLTEETLCPSGGMKMAERKFCSSFRNEPWELSSYRPQSYRDRCIQSIVLSIYILETLTYDNKQFFKFSISNKISYVRNS